MSARLRDATPPLDWRSVSLIVARTTSCDPVSYTLLRERAFDISLITSRRQYELFVTRLLEDNKLPGQACIAPTGTACTFSVSRWGSCVWQMTCPKPAS